MCVCFLWCFGARQLASQPASRPAGRPTNSFRNSFKNSENQKFKIEKMKKSIIDQPFRRSKPGETQGDPGNDRKSQWGGPLSPPPGDRAFGLIEPCSH